MLSRESGRLLPSATALLIGGCLLLDALPHGLRENRSGSLFGLLGVLVKKRLPELTSDFSVGKGPPHVL